MKKRKLNYRIYDPNPPAVTADYILRVFMEVNASKVEQAIREAALKMDSDDIKKEEWGNRLMPISTDYKKK